MNWGKSSMVVLGVAGAVSFSGAAAAASWVKLDTSSSSCHTRVAYPFATDCTNGTSGNNLQFNCGVNCWQAHTSQQVENIALSSNHTLWGYTKQGKVVKQSSGGSWRTLSVVECGTGTERKGLGGIAVTTDANGVETVWLWQRQGRFFFREFGSSDPGCWTRGPNIPDDFQQSVELGSYGRGWPWLASTGDLFLFFEGEWILLDSDTGLVGGNNAYVSDQFGNTLWFRSILGGWTLDTSWPSSRGLRAITNGSADGSLAVIDGQSKVWRRAP